MGRFEAWLKICCSSQPNQCFSPMRSLQTHTTPTVIWARKGPYRWMRLFWGLCEKTHTNVHQDARTLVSLFVPFLFGTFFPPFCFSPIIFAVEHKDHFEGDPPLAVLGPELKTLQIECPSLLLQLQSPVILLSSMVKGGCNHRRSGTPTLHRFF